ATISYITEDAMRHALLTFAALVIVATFAAVAEAKYPIASHMARRADGPYQPEIRRYVVVDPIAAPTPFGNGAAAHGSGHAGHSHFAHAQQEQWRRYDLATPVYPYGWFGARPANSRSVRGSYYDDYEQTTIFRGR
ncbi:MAG: hypothetical protein J0M17_20155, partial [Planctomycetes bacterium]|nr:hypothetical protein [Planctomycetota bacterium]